MTLTIHDTASRQKVPFSPRNPDRVGMYVCGPTVYDRIHIGNARPLIVFDVLYRLLTAHYPTVTYVRNITDIDDKINKRALERGIEIGDLTAETIAQFHKDVAELGCLPPSIESRATETIDEIIDMIARLIDQGHAYALEDGHVLFHVPSWSDYGRFARKERDDQIAGARVDVASYKKDPADFVLWKPSDDMQPGWESPWGKRGRPGWHIECSAMSEKHLGPDFDIHGGGLDLIFPHHQNEIAQSCCAHPAQERADRFAKYWMHNGYVMTEGEKMSKSLGNFYTVRDLLDEFPGEVLRLVILKTHYRAPLDFSKDKCREAKAELDGFYRRLSHGGISGAGQAPEAVLSALRDDMNTPKAIAGLHACDDPADLLAGATLLGVLQSDPADWFQALGGKDSDDGLNAQDIEALIEERRQAKSDKNFARADEIRDDLTSQGIVLEDKPGGVTEWRRA